MKTNLLKFLGVGLLAVSTLFTGCKDPEQFSEDFPRTPLVSAVKVASVARETAAIQVFVADADQLEYAVNEGSPKVMDIADMSTSPVVVNLEGLTFNTDYSVVFTAIAGDVKSEPRSISFKTTIKNAPTIVIGEPAIEGDVAQFKVTLGVDVTSYSYACSPADSIAANAEYAREWTKVDVEPVASQDVVIEVGGLKNFTEYVLEVTAENSDAAVTEPVVANFATQFAANEQEGYSVKNIIANPFAVSVEMTVEDGAIDGVCVYGGNPLYFSKEGFISNIEQGYTEPTIVSDTTYIVSYATSKFEVRPGSNVVFAAVAVKDGVVVGEPVIEYLTTPKYTAGESGQLSVAVKDVELFTANATITKVDPNSEFFYCGAVKKSEVEDGDIAKFIVDSAWLEDPNNYINQFTKYDGAGGYAPTDVKEFPVYSLSYGTEYYYIAIEVAKDGSAGMVNSVEFTTKGIERNEDLAWAAEVTPGELTADVAFTFNDCEKIGYYKGLKVGDNYTEEQIEIMILKALSVGDPYITVTNDGSGVGSIVLDYLTMKTEYTLYTIGMDSEGKYGALVKQDFATKGIEYTSDATLGITLGDCTVSSMYGMTMANFTLDVAMENGAASYLYASSVQKSAIADGDITDVEAFGNYVLANSWMAISSTDPQVFANYFQQGNVIVFIPVDADGAYGNPIVYELPAEKWEE